MDLIKALTEKQLKDVPEVQVGDTVRVHVKVKEGSRERIQVFEGTVIAKKHGGIEETITVRRISYGVGVEKVFPVHSPSIDHIEVVRIHRCLLRQIRSTTTTENHDINLIFPILYICNITNSRFFC